MSPSDKLIANKYRVPILYMIDEWTSCYLSLTDWPFKSNLSKTVRYSDKV